VYPITRRDDTLDTYHGVVVADPYRWLERPDDPAVVAWTEAQQRLTTDFLAASPCYERIRMRLQTLWDVPKCSVPFKRGNQYFVLRNNGLQQQPILYRQPTLTHDPQIVLDPNMFNADGTIAVTNYTISRDGTLLAYCVSHQGSEWQSIRVQHVATGETCPHTIEWCKFTRIAWKHDNSGFFYSRALAPDEISDSAHRNRNRIYRHTVGTPQSADHLVYDRADAPDLCFSPIISSDGAYLILDAWQGTCPENQIYYRPIDTTDPFIPLCEAADAGYTFIANVGEVFYIQTDLNAPCGRIIAIDIRQPQREHWREIIPEQEHALAQVTMAGGRLILVYMRDVQHEVRVYRLDGTLERVLDIPQHSAVVGLSGDVDDDEVFIAIESLLDARTVLRYTIADRSLVQMIRTEVNVPLADYKTQQVIYHARDTTSVPMYLAHHKDLVLDGNNPVLLTGYGGFGISLMPTFALPWLAWIEAGGVYAVANIRGGGEYGDAWHRAGMGVRKQNVFDDFIAAAEWLIAHGYTRPERLAIYGNSNGGLLVAACMIQRPELFGAVVCQAPLTDMLRYHHFTIGQYWIPEYGCADDSQDFAHLHAYSPLHNIRSQITYPPTLVLAADTDERVVPAHAKKLVAALQEIETTTHPILLRMEQRAGHGQGKPTTKVIDEYRDIYTFLFNVMGLQLPE
jgi:prolyl oligopeptidase